MAGIRGPDNDGLPQSAFGKAFISVPNPSLVLPSVLWKLRPPFSAFPPIGSVTSRKQWSVMTKISGAVATKMRFSFATVPAPQMRSAKNPGPLRKDAFEINGESSFPQRHERLATVSWPAGEYKTEDC